MPKLPDRETDEGIEARVLLAECPGPGLKSYNLAEARTCMEWMDRVLWNRVANPKPFGAKSGTLRDVVKAKGQFRGFETYPNYLGGIKAYIQEMLDIADNPKDKRAPDYGAHIEAALSVARSASIADPSPGKLVGWRTGGAKAPGGSMLLFATKGGLDFYHMK